MARYLITGGAGFIGSNIAHELVRRGDDVCVLDDMSTGRAANLADIASDVEFVEASITERDAVFDVMEGRDYCIHQAAIASVPRSLEQPVETCQANITGTVNVFKAACDRGIRRVVFASSSSVYGNATEAPVLESLPLAPISPYGITKATDEMYGTVFNDLFGMDIVALRYFNVFGPRQDPKSDYAAVIPIFIRRMLQGLPPTVHGDGKQSRDFTYVSNVVDANLRACSVEERIGGIYNVACGATKCIIDLVDTINRVLGTSLEPVYEPGRAGDIRMSWADVTAARRAFGYETKVSFEEGLRQTIAWYRTQGE